MVANARGWLNTYEAVIQEGIGKVDSRLRGNDNLCYVMLGLIEVFGSEMVGLSK